MTQKFTLTRIWALCLLLLVANFPTAAQAQFYKTYNGYTISFIPNPANRTAEVLGCYPMTSDPIDVVIPDVVEGDDGNLYTVNSIIPYAFEVSRDKLLSIKLPMMLEAIQENTFDNCNMLTSVIFPPNLKSIGTAAFQLCTMLSNIELPQGLTSIGDGAFNHCSSLQTIVIPESVNRIGPAAFANCYALKDVVILNPSTTVPTGYDKDAFYSSLTVSDASLIVPHGAAENYRNKYNNGYVNIIDPRKQLSMAIINSYPSSWILVTPDNQTNTKMLLVLRDNNGRVRSAKVTTSESMFNLLTSLNSDVYGNTLELYCQDDTQIYFSNLQVRNFTPASGNTIKQLRLNNVKMESNKLSLNGWANLTSLEISSDTYLTDIDCSGAPQLNSVRLTMVDGLTSCALDRMYMTLPRTAGGATLEGNVFMNTAFD